MISKFNYATVGRLGNYVEDEQNEETESKADTENSNSQPHRILKLLGGRDNVKDVDACMTRLRVTVKDITLVADEEEWKKEGALGLMKKGNGVQAVYGAKADILKCDILDIM